MIKFKKNGRPTKVEKGLVKSINNILSSMDEEQLSTYDFSEEVVNEPSRLNYIWDMLNGDLSSNKEELENVDRETGEIKNTENNTTTIKDESEKTESKDTSLDNEVLEETEETKGNEDAEIPTQSGVEVQEESIGEGSIGQTRESENTDNVNENQKENDMKEAEDVAFQEMTDSTDDSGVPDFFSPLNQPVKERSYNKQGAGYTGTIGEPNYDGDSPAGTQEEEAYEEEPSVRTSPEPNQGNYHEEEDDFESSGSGFDNVRNEAMEEMDTKDKRVAVKNLADAIFSGVEMLHTLGQNFVKMPEDKIQEKVVSGEIDGSLRIPIDERGTEVTPQGFFEGFNEQVEEALAYEPEFEEKIRPALEREMLKRDMGMTDGQYILAESLKYFGLKTVQAIQLRKTSMQILDTFVTMTRETNEAKAAEARAEKRAARRAVNPDSITTPPPANPIQQQPHDEEVEAEEIENEEE